jgi:hypothetical protein
MTEQELSLTLGIWHEPEANRLPLATLDDHGLRQALEAMAMARHQRKRNHWVPLALWLEFLPWHSLN